MSVRINYININFSISSRPKNIITCHLPHTKVFERSEVKKEKPEAMVQTDFFNYICISPKCYEWTCCVCTKFWEIPNHV